MSSFKRGLIRQKNRRSMTKNSVPFIIDGLVVLFSVALLSTLALAGVLSVYFTFCAVWGL